LIIARGDKVQALHIRPQTILLAGICLILFSGLYFGTTAYLVFRDDLVSASTSRQSKLRQDYEQKIAALQQEVQTVTTKTAADHATVEQKVQTLLGRQETLDQRQTSLSQRQEMLARLTDAARRAGFDVPAPSALPKPQASLTPLARPKVALASAALRPGAGAPIPIGNIVAAADRLDHIEKQIATMETQQETVVTVMTNRVSRRVDRLSAVIQKLGRKVPKAIQSDVGGPFIPITDLKGDAEFKAGVDSLQTQLERFARIRKIALALPLRRPMGNAPITSGFGARKDPFLGRPAMHPGIDFQAPKGTPARTVAGGVVIAAAYNTGGYGNMVDVDHGNGVVTRYGHLSAIKVKVGDKVTAGGRIGLVGSTGRSTGPHLHYEIRIDGQPIDPMLYLNAGQEIASLL
jgi:murein DD-endopeptidase MepM/ murein hydrolase activator NlpD